MNIFLNSFFVGVFFDLLHDSTQNSYSETDSLSVKTWQTRTCKKLPAIRKQGFSRELLTQIYLRGELITAMDDIAITH